MKNIALIYTMKIGSFQTTSRDHLHFISNNENS